jgi:maltooligosyltrehalose trehalohydrolase
MDSKIHFGSREHGKHKTLLEFYRSLINLRKEISSLSHLSKTMMEVKAYEETPALVIQRRSREDQVCGVFNFSENSAEVKVLVEKGVWQKVFDSSSNEWDGPGGSMPESIQSSGSEIPVELNSHSFLLYRSSAGKGSGPEEA